MLDGSACSFSPINNATANGATQGAVIAPCIPVPAVVVIPVPPAARLVPVVVVAVPPKTPDAPIPEIAPNTLEGVASSNALANDNKPPPRDNASAPVKLVASLNAEPAVPRPSFNGVFNQSVIALPALPIISPSIGTSKFGNKGLFAVL